MPPILNHLQYLKAKGQIETGSHSSRENTKLFYFDCGCVVIAEAHPMQWFRHFTIPCANHAELRANNYTYDQIDLISKRMECLLLIDGQTYLMVDFLEENYFCSLDHNHGNTKISTADADSIYTLPVNGEHTLPTHAGYTIVKRIS